MNKFELIYNCVDENDEGGNCNSNMVRRALNSNHAEDLIAGATYGVIAVASPLACPLRVGSSQECPAYVEKMGYYLGGGADTE